MSGGARPSSSFKCKHRRSRVATSHHTWDGMEPSSLPSANARFAAPRNEINVAVRELMQSQAYDSAPRNPNSGARCAFDWASRYIGGTTSLHALSGLRDCGESAVV